MDKPGTTGDKHEPRFQVEGADRVEFAARPTLLLKLRGEEASGLIGSVSLTTQVGPSLPTRQELVPS